mmetsp:Transcript_26844/g.40632  ORF Transcript_26844/g.40632 Transcript_26844/m.40632 type:complete len:127 (-) Transcript_26844:176-556(-)
MATESTITPETSAEASPQEEETRKLNDETFDTEADDSASEDEDEDDEQDELIEGQDAATMDLLDELVELFVEKNGREPNQEEVAQWIETFQSLQLDDIVGANDNTTEISDEKARDDNDKTPVVGSE